MRFHFHRWVLTTQGPETVRYFRDEDDNLCWIWDEHCRCGATRENWIGEIG